MKLYIASSLSNAQFVSGLADILTTLGRHEITYRWWTHGSVQAQGDDAIRRVALAEVRGVRDADLLLMCLPGGYGTHVELGVALATGKPVVLLAKDEADLFGGRSYTCAFYQHPRVTTIVGPIAPDKLNETLERMYAAWKGDTFPAVPVMTTRDVT